MTSIGCNLAILPVRLEEIEEDIFARMLGNKCFVEFDTQVGS